MQAGTALVTGASGYLASLIATWLTSNTKSNTNLVLSSRTHNARLDASLARLSIQTTGVVHHTTMHVGMAHDWWLPRDCLVDTIMHAAGVLDDATLGNATARHVRRVAAGKTGAGCQLYTMARQLPVQHMALMSSVAAVLGSPGQVC